MQRFKPQIKNIHWIVLVGKLNPLSSRYDSNNRILELDNVMDEDGGIYTCRVFSQKTNINKETTATLLIQCMLNIHMTHNNLHTSNYTLCMLGLNQKTNMT